MCCIDTYEFSEVNVQKTFLGSNLGQLLNEHTRVFIVD